MRYGKLFNTVEYNGYLISDISHRFQLIQGLDQYSTVMFEAPIEMNDTPESVSLKAYGTTDYWWLILSINEIIDPLFDWLMTDDEVQRYAEMLYGDEGKNHHHHYVDSDNSVIQFNIGDGRPTPSSDPDLFNETAEKIIDDQYADGFFWRTYMEYVPNPELRSGDLEIPRRWITEGWMPVTNIEYMLDENDKKRVIKLVEKGYVDRIIAELKVMKKNIPPQIQEVN